MTAAISLQSVTKRFGRRTVLDEVSLEIPSGSVLGLIGPNGAGKSTLIKIILGLLPPTCGSATVFGHDAQAHRDRLKRRIGCVQESPTIYRWMTVKQVIGLCRAQRKNWNDELCAQLVDLFELDERKKVRQLSKGMVTKLALLVSLAHEPDLLVLDEPTTGLDPVAREEFLGPVIQTVCERECTVLFSSHSIEDVEKVADRVSLIIDGQLRLNDKVSELLQKAKRIRAVLSDGALPEKAPNSQVWQSVDRREWLMTVLSCSPEAISELAAANRLEHIDVSHVSLSQLFKDIVRGHRAES